MFLMQALYADLPLKPPKDLSYPSWRGLIQRRLPLLTRAAGFYPHRLGCAGNHIAHTWRWLRTRDDQRIALNRLAIDDVPVFHQLTVTFVKSHPARRIKSKIPGLHAHSTSGGLQSGVQTSCR